MNQRIKFKDINVELNEKSKIMYCYVDLTNYPPFLCSKAFESWLYSDKWNDILGFIFEKILSTYIPSTLEECVGMDLFDGLSHDLYESVEKYRKYTEMNDDKDYALYWISKQYEKLMLEDTIDTFEIYNLLNHLKKQLNIIGIEFNFEVTIHHWILMFQTI